MKNLLTFFVASILTTISTIGQPLKDTVMDIDGNVYHTVKIGTQIWMVENLETTKYRNGDLVANITDSAEWSNLTSGAYCNYNNDSAFAHKYGRLYNWYAVKDHRKLVPAGWHIATNNEWATLTEYLGWEGIAGDKLKSTMGWGNPNETVTNSSGFTALPGGYRAFFGKFLSFGSQGGYWTASKYDKVNAWCRIMYDFLSLVGRGINPKTTGFSVRCLKDN